jgi:hypothetical protein
MVILNYKKLMIMKQMMTRMVMGAMALGLLFACEAEEDRDSLPPTGLSPAAINISVVQDAANPNSVTMTSLMDDVIPYWSYTDAQGNELGHSNQKVVTTTFPFAGTYKVLFTAYTRGGAVAAESRDVVVSQNNEAYFSAPEWDMLTNGVNGKTWILDMDSPLGYANLAYPSNNESWFPEYASNTWLMENKNWGEMTFNLNGGYNVSVVQTALRTNEQTTKTGSFSYDVEGKTLSFNGGVEMLYGGDYYPDISNWKSTRVIELTENSLRLAVKRDQDRAGQQDYLLIYHFKPKP